MKPFSFDSVLPPSATQANVYDQIEPLIQATLDGYSACIFAYGQTGSGKTHTMDGTAAQPGVIPRAVQSLFAGISTRADTHTCTVKVGVVEVYNEQIRDLLFGVDDEAAHEPGAPRSGPPSRNGTRSRRGYNASDGGWGGAGTVRLTAASKAHHASSGNKSNPQIHQDATGRSFVLTGIVEVRKNLSSFIRQLCVHYTPSRNPCITAIMCVCCPAGRATVLGRL